MSRPEKKDTAMQNAAGVSYAEIIRSRRMENGMNQEQLGAMVHVGKNAVGAWESGRSRPDLNSVPVICEALGLTLEEFANLIAEKVPDAKIAYNFDGGGSTNLIMNNKKICKTPGLREITDIIYFASAEGYVEE